MNKTLSIGLAGFSFIIEEHAYIKLNDYLCALRNSLEVTEADEVMHDIEIRIVEIFNESLAKREVINDGDVEKMIARIGTPEVITEQEEAYYSDNNSAKKSTFKNTTTVKERQLFRDPERQKIAGVCAGLAQYMGLDITIMRTVWLAIAILGVFTAAISTTLIIAIYIILWIVLPVAQTASDFLKMKGKPANFDNLKEESNKIVQFANDSGKRVGELYEENRPLINKTGNSLWNALRYILGSFFALMGIGCLVGSAAIFGISFMGNGMMDADLNFDYFLEDNNMKFFTMAFALLSTLIPAMLFFLISIKLFSPKTKLNYTGYVLGGLGFIWIGLMAAIAFSAAKNQNQYSGKNEDVQNIAIETTSDSIIVDVKKVFIPANFKSFWNNTYSDQKTVYKQDYPDVEIIRKEVQTPYLIVKKRADGYNLPLNVNIPVEISGNKITLPNYFLYPYSYRLRDYRVSYQLVVPQGMKVITANADSELSVSEDGVTPGEDIDEDENTISIGNGIIKINTKNVQNHSEDADSIMINGKKYDKNDAKNVIKENVKKGEQINIKIKDSDNEVNIKTE